MISAMDVLPSRLFRSMNSLLTLHGASAGDAAGRPQRTARLQRRQITDELARAVFPGALQREIPARLARHLERAQAGRSQILIQRADRMIGDDVLGPGD